MYLFAIYGTEMSILKATDVRKIDAFEMWIWWKLLRIPWTAYKTIFEELKIYKRLPGVRIRKYYIYFTRWFNPMFFHSNVLKKWYQYPTLKCYLFFKPNIICNTWYPSLIVESTGMSWLYECAPYHKLTGLRRFPIIVSGSFHWITLYIYVLNYLNIFCL